MASQQQSPTSISRLSSMPIATEASISSKKEKVFKEVEDLRKRLTDGMKELEEVSNPVKGQQQKQRKKKKRAKSNKTKKGGRDQLDELWNVLLKLSFKLPVDELRILLAGRRHGVQLQELRNHFAGMRHELRLVADLFPLYKIFKEEDKVGKGNKDVMEGKRKEEEKEKWEKLDNWMIVLANKVDAILEQQKNLIEDASVLNMEVAKEITTKLKEASNGKEIEPEVTEVIKEIVIKIKANDINYELLKVSQEIASMKEEIQLSHRDKLAQLAPEKPSTAAGTIEQSLLGNYEKFIDFQKKYQNLGETTKLCFLCLAFFPEGVVIKKRLLVYWWIGEGLIDCTDKEKSMEALADEVIDRLVDDGFLQIVDKMSGLEIDSYRMHPLVRSALVAKAKRVDFFDFEASGMPTARVDSRSCKACLVDDSFIRQDRRPEYLLTYLAEGEEEPVEDKKLQVDEKLCQLQAFFNHNRRLVDLKSNLFSKMKNLNVLHLGRWQNDSRHHIEVETTDFLAGLKYMKHLKYISLQGVSQIRELPELLCKLQFLRVLDLRACHNLQELPEDIGDLKLLTHLDISECFLLDGLPKSLSKLVELQVMKGFVIGDHNGKKLCTLQDLNGFKNLIKLTIHTSNEKFPGNEELEAFKNFVKLEKLSISWGRGTLSAKPDDSKVKNAKPDESKVKNAKPDESKEKNAKPDELKEKNAKPDELKKKKEGPKQSQGEVTASANQLGSNIEEADKKQEGTNSANQEGSNGGTGLFPKSLVKFDLQCFPHAERPKWLNPENLESLEKLYIRGGEMKTLGERHDQKWPKVQILLLKYLSGFMLTWDQLKKAFPELIYLEKVNCPRLTFYPCNERGEWKKD